MTILVNPPERRVVRRNLSWATYESPLSEHPFGYPHH